MNRRRFLALAAAVTAKPDALIERSRFSAISRISAPVPPVQQTATGADLLMLKRVPDMFNPPGWVSYDFKFVTGGPKVE